MRQACIQHIVVWLKWFAATPAVGVQEDSAGEWMTPEEATAKASAKPPSAPSASTQRDSWMLEPSAGDFFSSLGRAKAESEAQRKRREEEEEKKNMLDTVSGGLVCVVVYVRILVYGRVCACVWPCVCVYLCMVVCVYLCMAVCVCTCVWSCVCVLVYGRVCVYLCMAVCVCTHVHIQNREVPGCPREAELVQTCLCAYIYSKTPLRLDLNAKNRDKTVLISFYMYLEVFMMHIADCSGGDGESYVWTIAGHCTCTYNSLVL